jgi:hypothetical protein
LVEPVEIDMAAPKQLERLKKELNGTTHRIQTSLRSMNDMMLERYNSKADMTRYEILILTTSTKCQPQIIAGGRAVRQPISRCLAAKCTYTRGMKMGYNVHPSMKT